MRHHSFHRLPRQQRNRKRKSLFSEAPALVLGLMAVGLAGISSVSDWASSPSQLFSIVNAGCNIKGNISINSGERIYHVPGQTFYNETVIRTQYGERWFCSEAEARAAGWRKAMR